MSKTALIVDDSRLACKVLSNMLDSLRIKSIAVYSAEEALEHLRYNQPDIIFLDHSMPGMDGLETIKIIKDSPLTATVPVLMYTAKEGDVYVGQARALGAVDVLPKGLEKDHLVNSLEKLGFIDKQQKQSDGANIASTVSNQTEIKAQSDTATIPEPSVSTNQDTPPPIRAISKPSPPAKPAWHSFWQQRVEPYLNRQKSVHSDELRHSTKIQTRRLIKEIHHTLEHFEHALAHRMESHNDFSSIQQEIQRKQGKKWLSAMVIIMLIVQFCVIWFLWSVNHSNQELLNTQITIANWQSQADEQFSKLNQKVDSIDIKFPEKKPLPTIISLINQNGTEISELYPTNSGNDDYIGITDRGYQFTVNSQGEIQWPFKNRYYLTDKCEGDAFVNTNNAQVFKDEEGQIWYTDKHTVTTLMPVHSKRTLDNKCISLNNKMLELIRLQRDNSLETGIEEKQSMHISYSQ